MSAASRERDARQVHVLVRGGHVAVAGAGHQLEPAVRPRRRRSWRGGVAGVVERPDVVRDPSRGEAPSETRRRTSPGRACGRSSGGRTRARRPLVAGSPWRCCHSASESVGDSAIDRSPSSDFDSRTRRTFVIRSTSRQRSAWSSNRRTPVSISVRNVSRARSSVNARATRCTSAGSRIRHRFRSTFGHSTPSAAFESISSSRRAVFSRSWRTPRLSWTVLALKSPSASRTYSATSRGRMLPRRVAAMPSSRLPSKPTPSRTSASR